MPAVNDSHQAHGFRRAKLTIRYPATAAASAKTALSRNRDPKNGIACLSNQGDAA